MAFIVTLSSLGGVYCYTFFAWWRLLLHFLRLVARYSAARYSAVPTVPSDITCSPDMVPVPGGVAMRRVASWRQMVPGGADRCAVLPAAPDDVYRAMLVLASADRAVRPLRALFRIFRGGLDGAVGLGLSYET